MAAPGPSPLGLQPAGVAWTAATDDDLVVGAAPVALGAVGLFAQVAFAPRDGVLAAHRRRGGGSRGGLSGGLWWALVGSGNEEAA